MSQSNQNRGHDAFIAVVSDAEIAAGIEQYCAERGIEDANIQLRPEPLGDAPAIVNGGAAVVVVQAGVADEDTLAKLEQLCTYISSGGAFIAILDDPSAQAIRQLFRAGVTDVLPTPVAENELIAALNTARNKFSSVSTPSRGKGKIISVVKTSGGVGATTLSTNLGRELLDATGKSVAVIDLDIQFGTVGLALDLQPRMDVTDAIRAGDRLDDMLLRSIMTKHKSGLDVLTAPERVTPLDVITEHFIELLVTHLRNTYDIVILETPTAWGHWIAALFEASDLVVPVVETSVRSADGAKRMMRGFDDFGISEPPLFIVANKVAKKSEVKERLRQLGNIFGETPSALIRTDEKTVAEGSDLGRCLKDVNASAPVVQDMSNIAAKVIKRLEITAAANAGAAPAKKGLFGGRIPMLGDR